MARKKIRNYKSIEQVRDIFNDYFYTHESEVIDHMLKEVNMSSLDEVWEYCNKHCGFGFDCGWVWLGAENNEQSREWRLDNGDYRDHVSGFDYPYNSQSTTLKEIQLRKALKDLGLENDYYIITRLD